MAIDPNSIDTIRVGQLPVQVWSMSDRLPKETGTELKQNTVQTLADFIADYIGTVSSLAFNPTPVPDGGTLPNTTSPEFILLGKGTFHNVGGGPDIVTSEELNVATSNGSIWSLAVQIPIDVELAGIVQTIRQGYTSTAPSENAVFDALALKANTSDIQPYFPKIQITATASQTVFPIGTTALAKAVFWNGALLNDLDWSQSGTNITTTFGLNAGDLFKPI